MRMKRIIGWKRRCLFDKSQTLDTVEENKEKCKDLDTSCEIGKLIILNTAGQGKCIENKRGALDIPRGERRKIIGA